MDNMRLEVDAEKFNMLLRSLSTKNQSKAIESALRSAGNIIKKQTISNLDGVVNSGGIAKRAEKRENLGVKKRKDLKRGVKTAVFRRLDGITVHIKGLRSDGRLRWLENGTENRYATYRKGSLFFGLIKTSKKAYRGRIKPTRFFDRAVKESTPKAQQIMQRLIMNSIKRIVRKSK